jgi:4-hydroxy-tetrahydrodipicolinate reductase
MATKIGILGTGKTGGKVVEMARAQGFEIAHLFDLENPPTAKKINECQAIIAFVPGSVILGYLDLLLASNVILISGATGFDFPAQVDAALKNKNMRWMTSSNYSLGMSIIKNCVDIFRAGAEILNQAQYAIHEIHHTQKLDAPSGTALSWEKWLGQKTAITSERIGDVVGYHEMTMATSTEVLKISHEALDRKIFAEGALWSLNLLLKDKSLPYGLLSFDQVVEKKLKG